jgi:hypothetical protein
MLSKSASQTIPECRDLFNINTTIRPPRQKKNTKCCATSITARSPKTKIRCTALLLIISQRGRFSPVTSHFDRKFTPLENDLHKIASSYVLGILNETGLMGHESKIAIKIS